VGSDKSKAAAYPLLKGVRLKGQIRRGGGSARRKKKRRKACSQILNAENRHKGGGGVRNRCRNRPSKSWEFGAAFLQEHLRRKPPASKSTVRQRVETERFLKGEVCDVRNSDSKEQGYVQKIVFSRRGNKGW